MKRAVSAGGRWFKSTLISPPCRKREAPRPGGSGGSGGRRLSYNPGPEAGGSTTAGRSLRPFGSFCSPFESVNDSSSPDSSASLDMGPLSPPFNFSGLFTLKHEEPVDYRSCHNGLRYCPINQASSSGLGPYDVQLRGQFYQVQGELNKPFHN
uniref:Neurogenic differentiation factor domain-containing protein n=1 Tax=Neolamprologus brichardi TaxID=32507 RepID=A0A3Q4HA08_NEOBR